MPVGDWQFWTVSALAVVGLVIVIGPLLPRRRSRRRTRVKLTIGRSESRDQ